MDLFEQNKCLQRFYRPLDRKKAKNEVGKALMERKLGKSLNYGRKLSKKPHLG